MSEHYPSIRVRAENGYLIREGLTFNFYMRRPHPEVGPQAMRSLEAYLRAVGPKTLCLYADTEGYWQQLDAAGWEDTRDRLLQRRRARVLLRDATGLEDRYAFNYYGKDLNDPILARDPGEVCALSFWLPTEFLEEHGPERVRALALEVAAPLPFCSGHAGLSFNTEVGMRDAVREIRERCFRHPGLDIPQLDDLYWKIGTRVRGVAWLTFLGQPTLGGLGGAAGLRSRLQSPGTTVEEMPGERVAITLGPWPEAGDTERGDTLPAYRELAHVLEPWLYHDEPSLHSYFPPEEMRRWERRFLD